MTVQFIESNGQNQFAILPIDEYQKMLEMAELSSEKKAYLQAKTDDDELIPLSVASRLIEGENPIKVWREYRGYTQLELSKMTGIPQPTISVREKAGFATVLQYKKLAHVLNVDIDDLIP